MTFQPSPESSARLQAVLARYPEDRRQAALIPALYIVQEQEGWICLEAMRWLADELGVAPSVVLNTATFYTLLRKEPRGKYHLQICTNVSCWLRGSDALVEVVRERCGIGPDEVSDDRLFSCEEVQCLAACGTAPVAQINWDYHEGLTPERLGAIIDAIKEAGVAPEPLPPSPR